MLNWGVIGSGGIAHVFCNALQFSKAGSLAAIASRSLQNAKSLADKFQCEKAFGSYEALLADPTVDVVYIATIHPAHLDCVLAATAAKKHVLVEKPIGMNAAQAKTMIESAKQQNVFLMEGYMYRCHPQTKAVLDLINIGTIGQVRKIDSQFGFEMAFDETHRLFDPDQGGGAILDVGGYPMSMARLIAAANSDVPFMDPVSIKGSCQRGPSNVDHIAEARLKFDNGVEAQIATAVTQEMPNQTIIEGTFGTMTIDEPWLPGSPCRDATLSLPLDTPFPALTNIHLETESGRRDITVECDRDLYTYEADEVAASISARQSPLMSWADTLGNMNALQAWREISG